MGQNTSRPDNQDRIAQGLAFVLTSEQPIASRKGQLHAVGEADHHDQRCHDIKEHVEAEIEPAQRPEGQQDGDQRWPGRDDHERQAAEEKDRDQAAGNKADSIVDQPVPLDRIADLELHHGDAGKLGFQILPGEIVRHRLADFADDLAQFAALDDGWVEREDDEGKLAVCRQELAADDLIVQHAFDHGVIGVRLPAIDLGNRGAGISPSSGG